MKVLSWPDKKNEAFYDVASSSVTCDQHVFLFVDKIMNQFTEKRIVDEPIMQIIACLSPNEHLIPLTSQK